MIAIIDYNTDPESFGPQMTRVFADCHSYISEKVAENPGLGKYETRRGEEVVCTAEFFRKVADIHRTDEQIAKNMEGYERTINIGKGKLFVALDGKELVGYTGAYPWSKEKGKIKGIYVHPNHQGRGIGRSLSKKREEMFSDEIDGFKIEGDSMIYVPTITFHEKFGYKTTDEVIKNLLPDGTSFPTIRILKELRKNRF